MANPTGDYRKQIMEAIIALNPTVFGGGYEANVAQNKTTITDALTPGLVLKLPTKDALANYGKNGAETKQPEAPKSQTPPAQDYGGGDNVKTETPTTTNDSYTNPDTGDNPSWVDIKRADDEKIQNDNQDKLVNGDNIQTYPADGATLKADRGDGIPVRTGQWDYQGIKWPWDW